MSFVDDALLDLYGQDPDRFVARRAELARQARTAGDRDAAAAVAALRRPTLAASLVNRHVLAAPAVVARCAELGDRLRDAQRRLDVHLLRQLGGRRRALVAELTDAALAGTSRQVSRTVREDVQSTFDAAVADPQVTAMLGRLTAAVHWSGFGPTPAAPSLTLVPGGAATPARPATPRARRPTTASRGATGRAEPATENPSADSRATDGPAADDPAADSPVPDDRPGDLPAPGRLARKSITDAASVLAAARSAERAAAAEVDRLTRTRAELDRRIAVAEAALADARAVHARAAGRPADRISGAPSGTPAD